MDYTALTIAAIALIGTVATAFFAFLSSKNKAKNEYVSLKIADLEKKIIEHEKTIERLKNENADLKEKEILYLQKLAKLNGNGK